ncbi:MAG: GatB/YqeY domain-containing protein [Nitrosospira sp.]|nr:GatB/YqeY domain-containing protein [Nitrosospira sp.]
MKPLPHLASTVNLKQQISDDMKAAMRARDNRRRDAVRLLQAAVKQREVDERIELDDASLVAVIEKMLKQRRDSIAQFEAANRHDLADAEKYEMTVLQAYMPAALGDAEVEEAVNEAISAVGAAGQQDMGRVMAVLKPKLSGRADMSKVSALVRTRLLL